MLSTYSDIQTDFIRKMGLTATTAAQYNDAIIGAWAQQAHRFATGYKKWPHTQGRISTTYAGSEEILLEGYKADSIRMLVIDGKKFQKIGYEDYLILKEGDPASSERVYSDFGRLVVINPNTGISGTLTAYGQYTPPDIDITDLTATTVFSGSDEEANEAIVEEMLSYANAREKKEKVAAYHHEKAKEILDSVWKKVEDEQYAYQTTRARGGMFHRFNILQGGLDDEINRRDQFPSF